MDTVLRYFPPPDFIDFPVLGISFSDKHIRLVQFAGQPITLNTFAVQDVADGAMVDGSIVNSAEVVQALTALKKKAEKGSKKQNKAAWVRLSIPEERGYIFELNLPTMKASDIRGAIEFKMEENIPLTADKVIFDYVIVDAESNPDLQKIVVSAIPKVDIENYLNVLESAGFKVLGLETQGSAVAKAVLKSLPSHSSVVSTALVAHFATDKVSFYLISRGIIRFSSNTNLVAHWQDDPETVAKEIQKVASYWKDSLSGDGRELPSSIIVCGSDLGEDTATLLAPFLSQEVTMANVWTNVFDISRAVPEIPFLESLSYAPTIGMALPNERMM